MPGVFRTNEQWPLNAWDIVENAIQEFVHDDLEFDFWVGNYLSDNEPTMDEIQVITLTAREAVVLPILDKKRVVNPRLGERIGRGLSHGQQLPQGTDHSSSKNARKDGEQPQHKYRGFAHLGSSGAIRPKNSRDSPINSNILQQTPANSPLTLPTRREQTGTRKQKINSRSDLKSDDVRKARSMSLTLRNPAMKGSLSDRNENLWR
jgi:hypothetical protein